MRGSRFYGVTKRGVEFWGLAFDCKRRVCVRHKFYGQDLINHLFMPPYTKIEFLRNGRPVSPLAATNCLDTLISSGFLKQQKVDRTNCYLHSVLVPALQSTPDMAP
jgi:hypothetical protein